MGFLGRVFRGIARVAGFVSKIASFIQKPLDLIMKPIKGLADKFLDKLGPFGAFLKPLVNKFLDNAASFLMPGGLGILNTIMKGAKTVGDIANTVETVANTASQVVDNPKSLLNIAESAAFNQAQKYVSGAVGVDVSQIDKQLGAQFAEQTALA